MDWLQTVQGIWTLIGIIAGSLTAVVTLVGVLIAKGKEWVKLIKEKKYNELITQLKAVGDAAIRSVETTSASGADKKETVLSAIQAACNAAGAEFTDELKDNMSTFIDTSVAEYNQFKEAKESK